MNGTPASTVLTDISIGGYTLTNIGDAFSGSVYGMKLDGGGKTVEDIDGNAIIWQWGDWIDAVDWEAEPLVPVRKRGWMDGNGDFLGTISETTGEPVPNVPLAMGEGVWIQSDSTDWVVETAGQVYNSTVPVTLLENGSKFCANVCPANIKMSQTIITGYTLTNIGDAFTGSVYAMKLDGGGKTVEDGDGNAIIWQWGDWIDAVDWEADPLVPVRKTGWMDGNGDFLGTISETTGEPVPDVPLNVGEGVWVQSDSTDWQFVFPSPFELN